MNPDNRPDLAATVVRLGRALVAIEQPILDAHDVSMWGVVVLTVSMRDGRCADPADHLQVTAKRRPVRLAPAASAGAGGW